MSNLSYRILNGILERVSDGFVALDADWRYVFVNQKAAEMFQRKPEDLIGKHIWTEFPEGVGQPFYHAYNEAMQTQKPVTLEEYYEPWDRFFENRIYPSPEGLTIYFTEITERRRAERSIAAQAKLLDKENRLLELTARGSDLDEILENVMRTIEDQSEGALCSILLLDDDGTSVRHRGRPPSLPADYIHAVDGSPIGPKAGSCGTAMHRREQVIVTDIMKDPLWEDYRDLALKHGLRACWSTPIISHTGRVLGSFAMYYRTERAPTAYELKLIDLAAHVAELATERHNAQKVLHDREKQVSSIYATVGDVIFQVVVEAENKYRFTSVNRAFLEKTGLTEEQIVGKRVHEVIPQPSLNLVLENYKTAVESRLLVSWEETSEYPTGNVTGVVTISPLIDSDGKCTHLVGVVHDITARKRMEEELRKLNAELEVRVQERTRQFEEAAERALEADRLKSAFLATMSHELRTPLNSIIGFTGVLAQGLAGPMNDEQRKQIGMAKDSAHHLLELINDVLDLSRIEAGQMEISRTKFLMGNSIEAAMRAVQAMADKKRLELSANIDPAVGSVVSDKRRVEQILINLLGGDIQVESVWGSGSAFTVTLPTGES